MSVEQEGFCSNEGNLVRNQSDQYFCLISEQDHILSNSFEPFLTYLGLTQGISRVTKPYNLCPQIGQQIFVTFLAKSIYFRTSVAADSVLGRGDPVVPGISGGLVGRRRRLLLPPPLQVRPEPEAQLLHL